MAFDDLPFGYGDGDDDEFEDLFDVDDTEVAEELRSSSGGLFVCRRDRRQPEGVMERMARQALQHQGYLTFNKIAADKHGEIFEITRKKGGAKPGLIRHDGKDWKLFPALNFNFTASELDEICSFMEEQL